MLDDSAVQIAVLEDCGAELTQIVDYLTSYCSGHGIAAEILSFSSGESLLAAVKTNPPDLFFLDVYLPELTGIEVARQIREYDSDALIVFITCSPDHQAEAFDVWASGYVLKPVTSEKIAKALHACRFILERGSRVVEFNGPGGVSFSFSTTDLIYVEVYYKKTVLHTTRGNITARLPLALLEKQLGGAPFLRCNRSYIVNMNHVEDILTDHLLMSSGDKVPIRQRNRRDLRLTLAKYIAGHPIEVS